jgi:hypothetical protein
MKLPVDTSAIAFMCAMAPEPVVDFETRRPKADENGEPLYVIQLLAMGEDSADLLAVKVPGVPSQGIRQGARSRCPGWSPSPGPWLTARACRSGPLASSRPWRRRRRADRGEGCPRQKRRNGGGAGRPAVGSRAGPSTR